ncbi:MAG: metalloregulator ArsR/SmtB family transcription factor [Bacteroidetes bacterium]|nr:metalloregulator ArsR/SmtB family transcription factor [Bacteroidota bacterium]
MRRDVFQAIADPTRREIISLLAQNPQNINTIADRFPTSRVAISKHLKILMECGLVVVEQQGRERICEAQPEKLREVADWVEQYRQFWNEKLDSLERYLANIQKKDVDKG